MPTATKPAPLGGSNRLLSTTDAAEFLGKVPRRTLLSKQWRQQQGIPAIKVGKHVQFRERDLVAYIDRLPRA
jgi:excisionase family DNA binding protein